LPDRNGTIAALIVSSDKTTLSYMSGGQMAYPVYVTLGNIDKSVRRKGSEGATVLLGYLPVEKFEDVPSKDERERLTGELIHRAMEVLLEPLRKASQEGVEIWCADGRLRRVFPMMAAFVGDWPEQCLMACVEQGSCPVCRTGWTGRGDYDPKAMRTRVETLEAIAEYNDTNDRGVLDPLRLKPWWPWWASLRHVHINSAIAPDLLHQLHQGVFKSHMLPWLGRLIGESKVDQRFMSMTAAEGMTHFGKGVTGIQQWTGRESKEMMKQFLPLVAGTVDGSLSALVRAGLDFMYRAHAASMTEDDIQDLKESMVEFHELKYSVLSDKTFTDPERFDHIPKLHMITHYPVQIPELGTPDGYNTEVPERSHIPNAKEPWRASNRVNPWHQMIKWMQRREALRLHRRAMDTYYGLKDSARSKRHLDDTDDDDDDDEDEDDEDELEAEDEGPLAEIEATVTAAAGDDSERDRTEGVHRDVEAEGQLEGGERLDEEDNSSEAEPDPIVYPDPTLRIAVRPTKLRAPGAELVQAYGATDLIPALVTCLRKCFDIRPRSYALTLYDSFNVWHRFHLNHLPLPFAPLEPPRRDVVRAKPPVLTATGVVKTPGVFDTALFIHDTTLFGLRRKSSYAFSSRFALSSSSYLMFAYILHW
jgi:hypothetical protein